MSAWSVVVLPGGTLCASGSTCTCGQEHDHKYDAALCGPKAGF